jgi:ethanolamine permease
MTTADTLGGTPPWTGLARWQGTGLALAVVAWGVYDGLGALLGAVLLSPAIIALVRLRKHAPEARSTADLVGATLGNRAGMFTGALQVVAYLLLAVIAARAVSLPVAAYSVDYSAMQDTWSWPLVAVAAVVLAGLAAYLLPDRAIGGIAVVLAGVALLINFYLALAVLARVYRGVVDVPVGADDPGAALGPSTALLTLALGLVGFELVTVRNRRITAAGRSMTTSVVAVAGCATVVWLADHLGAPHGWRLSAHQFTFVVGYLYGSSGLLWLTVASLAMFAAGLLVLMWAITVVASRLTERVPAEAVVATSVGIGAALAIVCCRDWLGLGSHTGGAGALLLVVVYVMVVEASARLPDDSSLAWWLRMAMPAVLAAVVLIPLLFNGVTAAGGWPVAIAGVLAGLTYAVVSVASRR